MRLLLLIGSLCLLTVKVWGQSLLLDGSFENNTHESSDFWCQAGLHQYSDTWEGYGTCELMKVGHCAASPPYPVFILGEGDTIWSPDFIGHQYPRTGNYYAGIRLFDDEVEEWHEFLFTRLHDTLAAGQLYLISFYLSVAESEEYLSNSIGIGFTDSAIPANLREVDPYDRDRARPDFFYQMDHIMYERDQLLDNYEEWVKLEFYYEAQGGETHLVIGNFKDDAHTEKVLVRPDAECRSCRPSCRVFIDDVEMVECKVSGFELGLDSVILCEGEELSLDLRQYAFDVRWSDSTEDKVKTFSETGTYSVTCSDEFCTVEDSFYLYKVQPLPDISTQMICTDADFPLQMDFDYPFHPQNRISLNEEPVDELEIQTQGSYELRLENAHCVEIETFSIVSPADNLRIYPNPFPHSLTIETQTGSPLSVQLFTLLGQRMGTYETTGLPLDLSHLADGVYILRFEDSCLEDQRVMKVE